MLGFEGAARLKVNRKAEGVGIEYTAYVITLILHPHVGLNCNTFGSFFFSSPNFLPQRVTWRQVRATLQNPKALETSHMKQTRGIIA